MIVEFGKGEGLGKGLAYCALGFVLFWLVFSLAFDEVILGLALGLGFFLSCLVVWLALPGVRARKRAAEIEARLPFALMAVSVELGMDVQFEKTLERLAKENYGVLSDEIGIVVEEVKQGGASVQEALFWLGERVESRAVKRALSHLVNVYLQGGGRDAGLGVKRVALELLSKQKALSKEFSGKMVVYSLLFIAVSAIVPALFQAFVVVGSMFMDFDFGAMEVLLVAVLGFPLLDTAILYYIKSKTPVFLRS